MLVKGMDSVNKLAVADIRLHYILLHFISIC